jgi:hypothetical protein
MSLSGAIYIDTDKDGVRDSTDWGVSGAVLELFLSGSSTPVATISTAKDGSYSFTDLDAGKYSIILKTVSNDPGKINVGSLIDADGNDVPSGTGTVSGKNSITSITLKDGFTGVNYDFAELSYPVALLSKRMLLNTNPGTYHSTSKTPTPTPPPVPEPGTFVLLVLVGLSLVVPAWRRRR